MTDAAPGPNQPAASVLCASGRAVAFLVLLFAVLDWIGWATGHDVLTRINPTWPQMTPWTALWLFVLGAAVLVQSDDLSPARVGVGRGLASAAGVGAVAVLAEYATGRAFGLDELWFGDAVRALQSTWPGRPSPQTAISVASLSLAVGLMGSERRWVRTVRALTWTAALATPAITAMAYLFGAVELARISGTTGMSVGSALGLLLLGAAAVLVLPRQGLAGWLSTRPNRSVLIRAGAAIAGFPIAVGLSRIAFLAIGLDDAAALTFSTAVGTGAAGSVAFHLIQRDQRQREALEADRMRCRANADSMIDPQALLEAVRDPGGRVVDFRYLSVNQATCRYLGMQESDLVGHTQFESTPDVEGSEVHRRYVQCLRDGKPVVLDDYAFFNESLGEVRRYDVRAARAGVDLLSATWRDVTDRFRAAQRIAESEQNYRLLAENASDVIVHIRDEKVVWVSPSVEAALGAPPEFWLDRRLPETVPPEEAPDLAAQTATVRAGGMVQQRVQVVGADDTVHWFHMSAKPFYGADGQQDGALSTLRLIDDEVAAEQEAEQARRQQARAEARYRRSMDSAAIGMCLVAPDGAFVEVNGALCEFFGYDADTLMDKTWHDLTATEYLDVDLHYVNDILEGRRESYRMRKQYLHADGHRIWGDLAVSCIRDRDGRVENFIKQIVDITAEVEAREQLAQSDTENRSLAERLQRQSDRMAAELQSAAEYMATIMPSGLTGPVEVVSRYLPSRELGGDCFNYTWIDDDHLLVYLIDVSGHGIEPALLSVSVHNMLRSGSLGMETLLAPEAALAALNALFRMEQQGDHFFTMWYGVYQASTRTLRYASGGAPPALALRPSAGAVADFTELSTPASPVGAFDDEVFTSATYEVPHGCRILLFSDGAYELTPDGGRLFTFADFKKINARLAAASDWSLNQLLNELKALTPNGIFEDDCSLIQLTFK